MIFDLEVDEDKKQMLKLEDLGDKLQQKIKVYKRQVRAPITRSAHAMEKCSDFDVV